MTMRPFVPAARFRAIAALLVLIACIWSHAARAAPEIRFDIAAGRLSGALVELGRQGRASIVMAGETGADIPTRRVRGELSVEAALRRLLAGTGFTFRRTPAGDLIVVRALPGRVRARERENVRRPPRPEAARHITGETIIVTASKSDSRLSDYPGSVSILDLDGEQVSSRPGGGSAVLIDHMPVLAATSLGSGRNKIFARGVADSSFNGQSQSNVSSYFGDLRLNYSGPDPDLNLFDVRRVELLAGPQGTLYGAGALGGVIRIEPNMPVIDRAESRLAAGGAIVRHGGAGSDFAAMVNIPVASGRMAMRAVGYRTLDPGYIDDSLRNLKDVNRVTTTGARAALRVEADAGLIMDMGLVFQRTRAKDSQYVNVGSNGLVKRMPSAQPNTNDYLMPSLTIRKSWDNLTLVSATGWSRQRSDELSLDFSAVPTALSRRTSLLSHETRLTGGLDDLRFVAGISFARSANREGQAARGDDRYDPYQRLFGRTTDVALFGEASFALLPDVEAMIGGRISYIHDTRRSHHWFYDQPAYAEKSRFSLLPGASLSWKPDPASLLFLAYRSGSRGGNLFAVPGSEPAVSASRPDRLSVIEAGWRHGVSTKLHVSTTLSYTRWNHIQLDLPILVGLVRTVNLGRADIWGLEAAAAWSPADALSIAASAFLNNAPQFALGRGVDLLIPQGLLPEGGRAPNIASVGARASMAYEKRIFDKADLRLAAAMRYYGSSVAEFGGRQPEYLEIGLEARLAFDRWAVSLGATNLTDVRGNRFAVGNLFTAVILNERQSTPLQPRTIRLGVDVDF